MRVVLSILFLVVALVRPAFADLSSVRYKAEGRSHFYLSTERGILVGDRELTLNVYVLDGRYVAGYQVLKRRSASESEVVSEAEIAGSISGMTLSGLGRVELTNQTRNGKPVVRLTLDRDLAGARPGTVTELIWVGGSFAPKSVTGR